MAGGANSSAISDHPPSTVDRTLVSSLLSASKRRMTSFAGSDALLRENPASKGVKWPLSVEETRRLTVYADREAADSARHHAG